MLASIVQRTKHHGLASTLTYALGRFEHVRWSYGSVMGVMQRIGAVQGLTAHHHETCFPNASAAALAAELRGQAAAFRLMLPKHVIEALRELCDRAPRKDWSTQRTVPLEAIVNGHLPDGAPVFVADVVGADLHPCALRVTRDPVLLAAVTDYLGYAPIGTHTRIIHSPVVDGPIEQRRAVQTVDYHFDVHGYNFVYANFYLTDVDRSSGAHEMVLGSHTMKPPQWLFGSAKRSDQEILDHYGARRVKTIIGPADTGFLQDSSCYHRALAPVTRERLMLHIRYF